MPALKTLRELLVDELRDLHNAENQLVKALPKMAKAASHDELREGFEEHLEQTREHVDRLDRCFKILGANAKGKTCHAMKGLVEEGKEAIEADALSRAWTEGSSMSLDDAFAYAQSMVPPERG